jgi:hypothetical protein
MTGPDLVAPTDQTAVYAIHIAGVVGPMLVSSLFDTGSAASAPWEVSTQRSSSVLVSETDDDLVDVVRRLAAAGVEIDWVRERGAGVPGREA